MATAFSRYKMIATNRCDAILLKPDNLETVALEVGGEIFESTETGGSGISVSTTWLRVPTLTGVVAAVPGQYVERDLTTNRVTVWNADEFEAIYELV